MLSIRKILTAAAALGALAAAAPAANADTISSSTKIRHNAAFGPAVLTNEGRSWATREAVGPREFIVRNTITCKRGDYKRGHAGPICQWNSSARGVSATLSAQSDPNADAWLNPASGYGHGADFHAGTLRQGQTTVDEWRIVVRDDSVREADELIRLNVRSLQTAFFIYAND